VSGVVRLLVQDSRRKRSFLVKGAFNIVAVLRLLSAAPQTERILTLIKNPLLCYRLIISQKFQKITYFKQEGMKGA
jgi:hypothetical protein